MHKLKTKIALQHGRCYSFLPGFPTSGRNGAYNAKNIIKPGLCFRNVLRDANITSSFVLDHGQVANSFWKMS